MGKLNKMFVLLVIVVTGFVATVQGASHDPIRPRAPAGEKPKYPTDPNANKFCAFWIDVDGPWTCNNLKEIFGLSVEDFVRWVSFTSPLTPSYESTWDYLSNIAQNPSFSPSSCGALPVNRSYCVFSLDFLNLPSPTTTPSTTPTPSSPTGSTGTVGGIATPSPTQPGMVPNCTAFFRTRPGDTCATVSTTTGISLSDFLTWNPRVGGPACDNLWSEVYVCVAGPGGSPPSVTPSVTTKPSVTPTVPANGVVTPHPVQEGITENCKTFYLVQEGDICFAVARRFAISLEDFRKWNPAVGEDCDGLWSGTYCCVGVLP